jgi:hypothetical protein
MECQAIQDFVRGLFAGYDFVKEPKFVPTRVAICILLRELITIGATIDVARGLPVIHLDLPGYDEQAHRRGPFPLFAHWALKGIDDAIVCIDHVFVGPAIEVLDTEFAHVASDHLPLIAEIRFSPDSQTDVRKD